MKTGRTYTNLKRILNESTVNAQQPEGVLSIILEMNDPQYFENRAIELVKESTIGNKTEKLTLAITLLGLARLYREYE